MIPPSKPCLYLVVMFLFLAFSGCKSGDDGIVNPPLSTPVVVRSAYSYVLSINADNMTIDVRDSVRWGPHVAYLSITVSDYSSGEGTFEITDSSGTRVCLDSVNGNIEILNRRLSAAMPLRLRLSLHGFTGALVCGLQLGPTDINGMVARFSLRDSMGVERSSFRSGQRVDFSYSVVNMTGQTQHWGKADTRPMCRFTINRAGNLVRDSFEGLGTFPVPEEGNLQPGDSIKVSWRGISSQTPLPPAHYVAFAEPQFILAELGFLATQEYAFDINL